MHWLVGHPGLQVREYVNVPAPQVAEQEPDAAHEDQLEEHSIKLASDSPTVATPPPVDLAHSRSEASVQSLLAG